MGCCAGKKSGNRSTNNVPIPEHTKTLIAVKPRPGKRKDRKAAGFPR